MPYIALAMNKSSRFAVVTLATLAFGGASVRADTAADAYRSMGIRPTDVLTGTVLTAKVMPGADKQVVAVTTYMTGSDDKSDAVSVRLDVFSRQGESLTRVWGRNFGAESGGLVGAGELQLIDLDRDGINEIIASFESFLEPLIEQRLAEVIVNDDGAFRTAWSGAMDYDATRAARDVPRERRDRYNREIDFANTMRTRGITLFMNKEMIAVAGERLDQPKVVQETFPLRPVDETR
jgi:hypothetical protein